ncbi:hypothetical protein HanIR_Chr06g0295291 [Helianthus annuus]|nr:hypothetical protein HanIR_Chr06g0295291 [Helianthus annuus]
MEDLKKKKKKHYNKKFAKVRSFLNFFLEYFFFSNLPFLWTVCLFKIRYFF